MNAYVYASRTEWPIQTFLSRRTELTGSWSVIVHPEDLTIDALTTIAPRYVFLPHWSSLLPPAIVERFECVCFHMTEVPYGRGGSPLQNLIVRGHMETRLSALRMDRGVDSGPVYKTAPLSLEGPAHAIYRRAAEVSFDLMKWIVENEPAPVPQVGEVMSFARRSPSESALPQCDSLDQVYDFIRMLDADGYPRAFLDYGKWRLELSEAELQGDELLARVRLRDLERDGA